jgi:heme-degrading monooxygenase HmoA
MVSRHWKGIVRPGEAERYVAHLESDTFPNLSAIPGFVRATILRRAVPQGTEFQIVTVWRSLDAIRAFAGPDPEAAVVPPAAQAMMSSFDARALHYDVAATYPS